MSFSVNFALIWYCYLYFN